MAPVIPHVTEEIYQAMYAEAKKCSSLQLSKWPEMQEWVDDAAETQGDVIVALISAVRREKAERHLPLNTPVKKLTVCAEEKKAADAVKAGTNDVLGACKVENLEVNVGKGGDRDVADCAGVRFTAQY